VGATSSETSLLEVIARAARDPKTDIEKMQQLMEMYERRENEMAKRAFQLALANAKGEIAPVIKNRLVDFESQGKQTRYRYEDFAAIANVVDPVFARYGLSYRFRSSQPDRDRLSVTCIIAHADGYSEETTLSAPEDKSGSKNAVQAIGSAATYLQRYCLKMAVGIAVSNDDDGRGGQDTDKAANPDNARIDADQFLHLQQALTEANRSIGAVEKWAGCPLDQMTVKKYKEALGHIGKAKK
jgi:hypothetical protein